MKSLGTLLLLCSFCTILAAPVRAQERGAPAAAMPSGATELALRGPRWEIAGGVLLLPVAVLSTFAIGFLAGPGLFSCGVFGETDRECEEDAARQRRSAYVGGAVVGTIVGAVGIGLITHGARRVRRVRSAERMSLQVLPTRLARDGFGLTAIRSF